MPNTCFDVITGSFPLSSQTPDENYAKHRYILYQADVI